MTLLDDAYAAMENAPEDGRARLAFYAALAGAEVYLLLTQEPERGGSLDPQLFETTEGSFVLVFDTLERLAEFAGDHSPYAALPGRVLAEMLGGQGIGIALNPDVAPSSQILGSDAMDWLAQTTGERPQEVEARPEELFAPGELPEALLTALDARLAAAQGLAAMAYLAQVRWRDGGRGHLLALVDPAPGAERALARSVRDALVFSGLEAGVLDVAFFRASDPVSAQLAKVGLRFDIPRYEPTSEPKAPGMDPDSPPKLR
ncbi:SseB family protein [Palleronia caenipelagi]|uniref:SseB family protein n=1 Tax=Palleronia caenipelagi TaxID=2489174 RepID=A0A547QAS7_9RHOB|nr:SseB family protein [Palleronia caenipelagi]TRD23478.1 SseB family protein [Palleronia caenipelagi]